MSALASDCRLMKNIAGQIFGFMALEIQFK